MSVGRYKDFFYTTEKDLYNGMVRITWWQIDDPAGNTMEKGGFFEDDAACKHMTTSIDEYHEAMEQLGDA